MQIEDKRAQKRLEEWYEQQEQREKIEMILKMLPLNEKEIFEDYFMCEKSAREIQQANGGTLEGIRAAIRRIRKKARLEEQGKNYFILCILGTLCSQIHQIPKVGRNSTWQLTGKAQSFLESLKTQELSQQEMLNRLGAIVDAESAQAGRKAR